MEKHMAKQGRHAWTHLLLLPACYYLGAKVSLAFAVMPEVVVMLWIPNSILIASLFHYGWRRFGYFAVAIIASEIVADYSSFSITQAVLFGSINLLEATVAYVLLRLCHFDPAFRVPKDIASFVIAGPILAACVSSCAAATVYVSFSLTETGFLEFVRIWWFSDAIGLVVFTPLILSLWPCESELMHERIRLRWFDGLALIGGLSVIYAFLYSYDRSFHGITIRSFLLIPPVLYGAARFRVRTASVIVTAVAIVILYVIKNGQLPFGDVPIRESIISAQELLFILSTMSLSIATLLSQYRVIVRELEMRVEARTAELREANKQLELLVIKDALTGILNRRALFDILPKEIERHRRHEHPLALILFDVDHFKQINDRYGHAVGDAVLQHVASLCSKLIRTSDFLARYGGEEFVILAPETDQMEALKLAERIRLAMSSEVFAAKQGSFRVTSSFGVANLHPADQDAQELFRRADHALYIAKAAGRDQIIGENQARLEAP